MEVAVAVEEELLLLVFGWGWWWWWECFAWFSEKHCLLIAKNEGSFSVSLISDLLPVAVNVVVDDAVAVVVAGVAAVGAVSAAAAIVVVVVDGVVVVVVVGELVGLDIGVCAVLLLLLLVLEFLGGLVSVSSSPSSLASCWYISSTMGFHNRTLALMNQFET